MQPLLSLPHTPHSLGCTWGAGQPAEGPLPQRPREEPLTWRALARSPDLCSGAWRGAGGGATGEPHLHTVVGGAGPGR